MVMWNCLWVGALAGLVASRLIRSRAGLAPLASSVAVGVLGALLGGLAGKLAGDLPHRDLVAAGVGATLVLVAWAYAQRVFLDAPSADKQSDGG
jgi:uncharacterized membrane protein YeaQ/YmgE (transglycosylase-associated protein family)